MRLDHGLWKAREGVEERLTRLPGGIGAAFERLGPELKASMKAFWAPGLWWEELDWAYMGVVDGHDVRALRRALRAAFEAERPVVVHVATVKGKGFAPAEEGGLEGMEKWHAAKPKSIAQGVPAPAKPGRQGRAAAVHAGLRRRAGRASAERDERVVGITAAMNSGTGLSTLQKAMPERYFDVGIAEQQALLFAAGLALQGARPVAAIYSTFLQRAYDQIVHDVCLQSLPVVLCLDRAGLVGDDGPTHHGAFDIAYLRCLPNITLMAPRDEAMLVHMLHTALRHDAGPVADPLPARRGGRRAAARHAASGSPIGTGEILREGERVALVGYGSGVEQGARRRRPAGRRRARRHGRRRPLRQAARRRAAGPARGRARPARDRRGGRAGGRLRDRGVGVPERGRRWRRGSSASGCRTATSPTARRGSCTRRSASRRSGSPSASRRPCSTRAARWRGLTARGRPSTPVRPRSVAFRAVSRVRLDSLLAERGLFASRSRAAAAVLAGDVHLGPGRRRAEKPGQLVDAEVELAVDAAPPFVSRGGVKLANALDALGVDGRRAPLPRRRRLDRRLHRLPAAARTRRTWWRSTSPTASWTASCARTRG